MTITAMAAIIGPITPPAKLDAGVVVANLD
jgi:hypothetical protein